MSVLPHYEIEAGLIIHCGFAMNKTTELMRENLRTRRTMLMCFAPHCECPLNSWAKRPAILVEALIPAQWACDVCRRTWTYEPMTVMPR